MTSFRSRPSHRRDRAITAKAIVLGTPATAILHQGRTAHLLPVKSGDHRSRYATGQRLAIKVMVPGPTECHVTVTSVQGIREQFTLGHVTIDDARELGHHRLDAYWRHWITNHDQAWLGRHTEAGTDTDEQIAARFERRWAGKLAWLIRFRVATILEAPRMLAARGGCTWEEIRQAQEAREHFRAPNDTDADHGYTTSDSQSLRDAGAALTDEQWALHIGPQSRYREQDRLAERRREREAKAHPARLAAAKAAAKAKGCDISREVRLYEGHVAKGKPEKALRQLELIEARVFPVAA